jgi:F-type H+-transporting ATPase subunit gamma
LANLKHIRKRIASVKSTQKITRAMKMVAGARLNRAQQRISALRPYAVKTGEVLRQVTQSARELSDEGATHDIGHPLLVQRPENSTLILVITSDRGLCGAFNANINRFAERLWHEREAQGKKVELAIVGRKGRDYFRRRKAPVHHVFSGVWDRLDLDQARAIASLLLKPFMARQFDAIYIVYNEFKSAMTQRVTAEALFPLAPAANGGSEPTEGGEPSLPGGREYIFEPNQAALLERLVPMYVEISILRALYESMASELGARMTAMDSATKNAAEMIDRLTLEYNRARQAAITTELMEIIGGANALSE